MKNDVDYYNKEITENNKEITKYCNDFRLSSSGLASLSASPLGDSQPLEVALVPAETPQGGFDTPGSEFGEQTIKPDNVKRAIIQLWHNPGELREWKLKVRLNLDFGDGEENADFICPLNKDWGNFTKYHPAESKSQMVEWARAQRKELKSHNINPYLGKFHASGKWLENKKGVSQKEPWTSAVVWYDKDKAAWFVCLKIYGWEEVFELSRDGLNAKQAKCKGHKIWMNPNHYAIERPLTWAQKRFGKKS